MAPEKAHQSIAKKAFSSPRDVNVPDTFHTEEEWRAVFDALDDAIMILDKNCRILMVNKAAAEFLGAPLEDIIGEFCYRIIHGTDQPVTNCPTLKMFRSGECEKNEQYLDGKGVWTRVLAYPSLGGSQSDSRVVHIIRDINSEKRVDDALRKRMKELNCLYALSRLIETKGNAVGDILKEIPEMLTTAFRFPDVVAVMLRWEGNEYCTPNWKETPWMLGKDIIVTGEDPGTLWVAYLEKTPDFGEEVFLKEEENLLQAISERLGHVIERKKADEALRENEEKYRINYTLLETQQQTALDGILVVDEKGKIISYNQRFIEIWNLPEDLVETRSNERALEYVSNNVENADEANAVVRHLYEHSNEKSHDEISLKDGRTLDRYSAPMVSEEDHYYGRVWYFRDITKYKQAQNRVDQTNIELKATVDKLKEKSFHNSILSEMREMLQACASVTEVSSIIRGSMAKLFPYASGALFMMSASRSDLESVIRWDDFPEDVDDNMFAPDACWALRRGRVHLVENSNIGPICPHLKHLPQSAYVCLPLVAKGDVLGLLHLRGKPTASTEQQEKTATDLKELSLTISEYLSLSIANIRLGEKLASQSVRDPLTGLFNRRYMMESLQREIMRAERKNSPIGIVMADIDHFKQFNDRYGHAAGDELLKRAGEFFISKIRGVDVACRYGGEEFILFLPESSMDVTARRMEEIREGIHQLEVYCHGDRLASITLSMGIAVYPDHGTDVETILGVVDKALYRAKQEGRNRIVIA